ncbi:uncharacterized protein LOC110861213 isoform X2 [Folsomia candida]|uniref:Uncharacterized protein n=1 Tax=Folsomia candida TaxID=158441 RepID=A0A226D490_FOLCA|nr:uncharacterized protein LOC110861213 isoform X2 [Folsomia candida]OXA39557.1 hypothetical protein Fcan01_25707 [Folsomia candida]
MCWRKSEANEEVSAQEDLLMPRLIEEQGNPPRNPPQEGLHETLLTLERIRNLMDSQVELAIACIEKECSSALEKVAVHSETGTELADKLKSSTLLELQRDYFNSQRYHGLELACINAYVAARWALNNTKKIVLHAHKMVEKQRQILLDSGASLAVDTYQPPELEPEFEFEPSHSPV